VAGASSAARSRARIARICERAPDSRTLRIQVLEELSAEIAFDAYAWLLTDPGTSVGAAPLADVPWLAELPRQIGLKYLTPINRWTTLGGKAVATLHAATGGELSKSLIWRNLLDAYGVSDAASVVFEDRHGCWAFLELWRSGGAVFTEEDADHLRAIAAAVTQGLRRCAATTFAVRPTSSPAAREPRRVGPVVLLLSPELQVRAQTPETTEYLSVLVPPAEDQPPIPASAYNVAAQLLAIEAGVDANPASARVHLTDGLWVTLRAARIGHSGLPADRDIAVTIEETSPLERVDLFVRAFGLSARERELLDHLVAGSDTTEVAGRMFIAESTVQDHLKSIFAKTSSHNRRTLLSRALGA
jgi:DNA-binding CsgD family transcriptional regulator